MRKPKYLKNVPHFLEEILDPRTKKKRVIQVVDAKYELTACLEKQDVWGARSKFGDEGHLSKCVQDNAVGRIKGVYGTQTTNSLLKVIFTDNIDVAYRYELPDDGKAVAKINDDIKKGKKDLLNLVPMQITYKPPRWNRSIEYSQSEEMAEKRRESKERRTGESSRAYAVPTESGFRDARRWHGRCVKR